MPNGGPKPSCRLCQWATRTNPEKSLSPIYCRRHQLKVRLSALTLCPDLSNDEIPGFNGVVAKLPVEPDMIYQWLEFPYRDSRNPTLPMYYTELAAVAPIAVYAT